MHHVDLVDEAPQEAAREGAYRVLVVAPHGLLDLRGLVALRLLDQLARHVASACEILVAEVGPELGVVHQHADVAQSRDGVRQLGHQPLVRPVEAPVVADLHHPVRGPLGGDDRVDVLERDRERLLAEHVQSSAQRVEHGARMGRVRRCDDHRVEPGVRDRLGRGRNAHRDREPIADPLAHRPARVRDRDELEPVTQEREMRQVHRLADQPGADHRDPFAVAGGAHATPLREACSGVGRIRSALSRISNGTSLAASSIVAQSLSTSPSSARWSPRRASSA